MTRVAALLVLSLGCAAPIGGGSGGTEGVALVAPAPGEPVGGVVDVVVDMEIGRRFESVHLVADDTLGIHTWYGTGGSTRSLVAQWDTAALEDGMHTLRVVAAWADGSRSEAEQVIVVDNGGPLLRIDEPLDRVFHEDGTFSFGVSVSDVSRITALRLRIDGLTVEEIDPVARENYVISVDPTEYMAEGANEGRVLLSAEAVDAGGNVTTVDRAVALVSRRLWTFATLGRIWAAPEMLWDGGVAVVTSEGVLHVIEPDGSERCHARADGERGTSSPTYIPTTRAIVWGTTHRLRITSAETCAQVYVDALASEFVAKPLVTEAGRVHAVAFDGTLVSMAADGSARTTVALGDHVAGGSALEMRSGPVEGPGGDVFVAGKVGATGGALFAVRSGGSVDATDLTAAVEGDALVTDTGVYFGAADGGVYAYGLDLVRRWVVVASDGLSVLTRPAFDGDTIVIGDGEGRIHGRAPATGDVIWEYDALLDRSPTGVGLVGRAGVAMGPTGDVAFGDALGMLHVLSPGGALRFRSHVAGGGTGDGIVAAPALSSERIYVGAENQTLTAFALH